MNAFKLLAGAVLFGGLISASSFASSSAAGAAAAALTTVPAPSTIVAPEGLPRRFVGTTVKLTFTVDENGRPHDIALVKPTDRDLARSLVPALAQWRFTPAQEGGIPVAKRVMLPLTLTPGY